MFSEKQRLIEDRDKKKHWHRFGPYLSERQWGTVREDYSENGEAWNYFNHDQARFRTYRWGEDGIGGISDNHERLCLAFAFWNGQDPILKERLFGLGGKEGNHGEDVKEIYFYLDNTPTHSYMRYLYKYPQREFPYDLLVQENARRGVEDLEYELIDTGIFNDNRYFDIFIEYAKADEDDLLIRLEVVNHGLEAATLHLLPTLWFRNTWSWDKKVLKPSIQVAKGALLAKHPDLGAYYLYYERAKELLFTDNETNQERLFGKPNPSPYVKDAFHQFLIHNHTKAVNPQLVGTKAAVYERLDIPAKASAYFYLRLTKQVDMKDPFEKRADLFIRRKQEADDFYKELLPEETSDELRMIQRQAFAGLLWNKQFYHYILEEWLYKDAAKNLKRKDPRNVDWLHVYNDDILSVPDKWEYPCFFSWDSAFHTLPFAMIDPEFAKRQLILLMREWYMHPNGQIPAYEWSFSDVNPPVHSWACWRVYKIEKKMHGVDDRLFLERMYQKLLLNFTWWINRKDSEGKNVFQGGFLGLDNISVFNRSEQIPANAKLYQSDATSWMGMYCLNMLTIA
ncbi:MAG: MGH1-like glycoside hydrolase domain-containing protein, partial [Anaerolineae bacterium]